MARFTIFGVPMGFSSSDCPREDRSFLQSFYNDESKGFKFIMTRRPNGDVHYLYLMYADENKNFIDANGRCGAFFGMDISFPNQCLTNTKKLLNLFQKTYDDCIKDKIVKELPNGNKQFVVNKLSSPNDKLANDIGKYMIKLIQDNPELNIFNDVIPYSAMQEQIAKKGRP